MQKPTTHTVTPDQIRRHMAEALNSMLRQQARGRRGGSNLSGAQRNAELAQALQRAQRNL